MTTGTKFMIGASLLLSASIANALFCYETKEDGSVELVENVADEYCVYSQTINGNTKHKTPWFNGIDRVEDGLGPMDSVFAQNDDLYSVQTVCVLEKYSFPSPSTKSEYLFRCYCRKDGCNKAGTFQRYLQSFRT